MWEGERYQSLYLSPLGKIAHGVAFIVPCASAALCWFPNLVYNVMRGLLAALVRFFLVIRDVTILTANRLLNRSPKKDKPIKDEIKVKT